MTVRANHTSPDHHITHSRRKITMAAASTKTDAEKTAQKDQTYANGLRAAREAKGYGRVAIAEALGISVSAWWKLEFSAEGKELAAALKEVRALEPAPKPERKAKAEKAPAKAAGKTAAKPKVGATKAKPAAATDLI